MTDAITEQAERLISLLREGLTVLDEPFHREAIATTLEQAATLLESQSAALAQMRSALEQKGTDWIVEAENWRHNRGQRSRAKSGHEVLEACGHELRALAVVPGEEPRT